MGKDSAPAAPPPPDYTGAAQATSSGNLNLARFQTQANRINQYTPFGSQTYTNNRVFDQAGWDAAVKAHQAGNSQGTWVPPSTSGGSSGLNGFNSNLGGSEGTGNTTPVTTPGYWSGATSDGSKAPNRDDFFTDNWSQTTTLDPKAQAALDSQLAITQGKSDTANQMLGAVKDSYAKPFNPTGIDSYLKDVGSIDHSSVGRAGDFNSSANINTDLAGALKGVGATDQSGLSRNGRFADGSNINTSAPTYDGGNASKYAKAAYEAQMALMQPGLDRNETKLRNNLAIQGLAPGSEASDNALGEFNTGRTQQLNNLAQQSVLTGNQLAQSDFASKLSEFQAGNAAQGQKFGQGQAAFTTDMNANMNNAQLKTIENSNQAQAFAQAIQAYQTKNSAESQKFAQDKTVYDTKTQALTTNAALQQAQNQAQQQSYAQALSTYGTKWQQDQTLRNMPLNELNALLTGSQVQAPNFSGFAQQGQTAGPDLLNAAVQQGQWNQGVWNRDAATTTANNNATTTTVGSLAAMAAMYY
jgi:hypothetical protein